MLSSAGRGTPVYAASDIRRNTMVLDSDLLVDRREFERILLHEAHHFIWAHMGYRARRTYEDIVAAERSRGELGWSAEKRKIKLTEADRQQRTRKWRDYVCESFCDTGAWYYARSRKHPEWTLAPLFRERRARWFREYFGGASRSL